MTDCSLPLATVVATTNAPKTRNIDSTPAAFLPEVGFLRQSQVLAIIPISKSTLWRRIRAGTFPRPIKLSARVTVWRVEDIRSWIARQGLFDG